MGLRLQTADNRIDFIVREERFTSYLYGRKVPGFSCLYSQGLRAVTQTDPESGVSLWVAHGNVNGIAFGSVNGEGSEKPAGRIATRELTARKGSQSLGFRQHCDWIGPDGVLHMTDTRLVRVLPGPSEGAILELTLTLTAPEQRPVLLGQTEDALLLLRLAAPLLPANGGHVRHSAGEEGLEDLHGRSAAWCACMGVAQGETVGIAFLEYPRNPWFPSPWLARADGLISPSPFLWRSVEIEPGRSLSLRYRLMVHSGYVEAGWAQERLQEWERE
jgi:hypothetical protein